MATENGVLDEKKGRKSVSFSDTAEAVNGNGSAVEATNDFDGAKSASSHQPVESTGDKAVDEITDMFKGLTKKKKTKKPKEGEKKEDDAAAADDAGAAADGEFDASTMKKKKKKKTTTSSGAKAAADTGDSFEAKLAEAGVGKEGDQRDGAAVDGEQKEQQEGAEGKGVPEGEEGEEENDVIKGTGIWAHDATQPISYALLLSRFYMLLHSHHPDLASSGTKSYKIPPPQCLREGNKKTIFANISEICKRMRRSDEHVTQFIFAELGTSGSVDGSRRLVIRGRFQQKQLENVLRRYIMEYVTCKTCRSPDTELNKGENRLYFVTCNSCGSRRSVTAIKTGFTAQIGKRRRQQG